MVVHDELYIELAPEQQNILKWAALLHDISKLSMPVIEGKDHCHPFKSARSVLDIFEQLGFIIAGNEQNLFQIKRLFDESLQPVHKEN